MITKKI